MKKDQERYLYLAILNGGKRAYVREIINKMVEDGIVDNYKQPVRTLEKWLEKDIYEYGVSIMAGWFTIDHCATPEQIKAHIKLRKELGIEDDLKVI